MFTLNENRVVEWPIKVQVPKDGGKFAEQIFTGRFKLIGRKAAQELMDEGGFDGLLRGVLVDWDGASVEGRGALPFNAENLDLLLNVSYVRMAMMAAWAEAASGGARAKN